MGDAEPAKPKGKKKQITARPERKDALAWFEQSLIEGGAASGISTANYAERVFFTPEMDPSIPIKEGYAPVDWEGYHAGKHGVYERFENLKGEGLTMGELFFKEKYRWVRKEWLTNPNELALQTKAEFQAKLEAAFKDAPKASDPMIGVFDSQKFTQDIKSLLDRFGTKSETTVWQGRYLLKSGELAKLQTNVDFAFEGQNYRIAIDAESGQVLNFFVIMKNPKFPMKFGEIVIKWKGKVTNLEVYKAEGSTLVIEISATWKGLFRQVGQGAKVGLISGAVISAFFGAVDGFRKEGLVGALKGMAMGIVVGGAVGGAVGGVVTLASRFFPIVGKVVRIGSVITIVASILLEASETGLDPQEYASSKTDDEGYLYRYRHILKEGSIWSPEYVPHGLHIRCPDGTVLDFGESEYGSDSSYRDTPITVYARSKKVNWHSIRTPDGRSLWWWMDLATKEEFAVGYANDEAIHSALTQYQQELPYRFKQTHG